MDEMQMTAPLAPGNFYLQPHAAHRIMTAANFPDEFLGLLQMESLFVYRTLLEYGGRTLVELGCYDGRGLEICRLAGVDYLGIDLNDVAVRDLRRRILSEGMAGQAEAVVADVMDIESWAQRLAPVRTVAYLPFNFLGCVPAPALLLSALAAMPDTLVLISVFNSRESTSAARSYYYEACGVRDLRRVVSPERGVIFSGANGFFSQSFSETTAAQMLGSCGLRPLLWARNDIGYCVVASKANENGGMQ